MKNTIYQHLTEDEQRELETRAIAHSPMMKGKGHTKDCWCPTTKKLYLRTSENGKQKFMSCGMICTLCWTIQFDNDLLEGFSNLWTDKVKEIQEKRTKSN